MDTIKYFVFSVIAFPICVIVSAIIKDLLPLAIGILLLYGNKIINE